jgi:uncharacterized membrane protein YhdT
MTTSFAWLTRGRFDRAWEANPAGCFLALSILPLIGWLLWSAWAGELAGSQTLATPFLTVLVGVVVLSLAFWLVRLIFSSASLTIARSSPVTVSRAGGR